MIACDLATCQPSPMMRGAETMDKQPSDSSDYREGLKKTKDEWTKRKHLFNAQELELYNQLDDMVPMSQALAEIQDLMGPDESSGDK